MTTITGRDTGDECECLNCQGADFMIGYGYISEIVHFDDFTMIVQPANNAPPEIIKVRWPEGWTARDFYNAMTRPITSIHYYTQVSA